MPSHYIWRDGTRSNTNLLQATNRLLTIIMEVNKYSMNLQMRLIFFFFLYLI